MKKVITSIMAVLSAGMAIQAAESPETGLLKGRILDDEKNPLPGAVVILDDNSRSAITDVDGFYSFTGLPAGNHRVKVTYIGYLPSDKVVSLTDGSTTQNFVMSDKSKELDEVVVTGVFSGQQRAINAQKNNVNITNVVSADQIGKFPDSNIGDALKRISGINVQYDQGEARFGQVRGTPADFSSVSINGSRIPSAEGDIRNVQLDLIPSDMIQTIEVNKSLMPDQDGDAIGGSINLITKNSPQRFSLNAVAGTGYNWVSRKAQMNFGLTAGNRFLNDRLGLMLSASYNNAPSGSYDTEFLWEKDDDDNLYISDYQIRQYFVTRERQSYALSLDYKFDDFNKIWFKGIFNNRNDWENRYRTTLKDITPKGVADVRVQTKGGSGDERDARLERQRTMDFTLGGENKLGPIEADWKIGYARASEERPNERYIDYRLRKQHFTFDLSDPRTPFATPDEGYTMEFNDKFSLKDLTQQQEDIVEQDFKIALDFKTRLSERSKIKFGFKFVNKTKDKEIDFYEYSPLDEDRFDSDAFASAVNWTTDRFMPSPRYKVGSFVSKEFLSSLDLDNASLYEKSQVPEELAGNYSARENVTSVYARIDSRLSDKLNFTGGLRVENTALRYIGRIYDDEANEVSPTDPEKSSYINFLPSLLLKWDVNKDFIVRTGYNQSISRPKYSALVPGMNIKRGDNEIVIGNPGLEATTSHNIDLTGEYYWKSIGLVSAGVFYKHINGFIVDEVAFNREYEGHVWTKLTQPKNGGNANIFGAEFAWQRDFSFINPALRCIGLYGTYTYTHSRVTDFNFTGREKEKGLSLPGSPKHTANMSVYFEKYGISARMSFNYASAFIDEMGASKFYDRYYDDVKYMDFNISYTFGKKTKFTVYADLTNLLNQPLRYYQGSKDFTMQQEYYGVKFNGGIKMAF
ncbi:MAG: TonB-dependent receptor [Bacteroidales bacterium 52_46]|nr:MAG: TonB-dependent receptor [Bacteroidales bacterium 52_46]